MMTMKKNVMKWFCVVGLCAAASMLAIACGDKLALEQFPTTARGDVNQIFYSPLPPVWTTNTTPFGAMRNPTDIIAGYDNTFYVADFGNNRVINFDAAGNVISVSARIPNPKAIAQARDMKLYVIGTVDTLINFGGAIGRRRVSAAALYQLDLIAAGGIIASAPVRVGYSQPIQRPSDTLVRYTGVATIFDNSVYVASSDPQPADSPDPNDTKVLFFSPLNLSRPLGEATGLSTGNNGLGAIGGIASLTTFAQPPQSPTIDNSQSFFFTTVDTVQAFKVQRVNFVVDASGSAFIADRSYVENQNQTLGRRFLGEVRRFVQPTDITIAADTRYIFVTDAGTDSLYQFTLTGIEGVPALPTAADRRNTIVSFSNFGGANGDRLRRPQAVCYLNANDGTPPIVYVVDSAADGTGRVLRFRLSTDIR
jgi:hypothetical protein